MSTSPKKIAIVGAGITGLAAAYYAQQFFKKENIPAEFTLYEKEARVGGKISTLHHDGFVIERGPDSFLARKTAIIDLTKELGLEDKLTGTNPQARKTYILHQGRLHQMPPGLMLGVPTEFKPLMQTKLLSFSGKARAVFDLFLPRRKEAGDEALGSFLKRRLGAEIHDHLAEPLLAGIYAGDTSQLSLQATFPQFYQVEQKYRSLILGMLASKKRVPQTTHLPEVAKRSIFLTYKTGLSTLVKRLEGVLKDKVRLATNTSLQSIAKRERGGYSLTLSNGDVEEVDALILTLAPPLTADLLADFIPSSSLLRKVNYVSVANVVMTFDAEEIDYPLDGSGFVVPNKEGRQITACTWTSSKWVHTAPAGKVLLRCYVGHAGAEEIVAASEEEILAKVRQDIKEIMGITATPQFYEVTLLPKSMPQYPVGHLEHIAQVRQELAENLPSLLITGSGYEGVGIPDCIAQGKKAAEELCEYFR